jgi:predicted Na+-dependent transporter
MAGTLADGRAERVEHLVTQFSGANFIVWVLLPTAAGLVAGKLITQSRLENFKLPILVFSAACLLALNFVNASQARIPEIPALAVMLCFALMLSVVGLASAWIVARLARLDDPIRIALLFGLSMKHNGLALTLASVLLQDQPLTVMFIVVAILVQHAVAAVVDAWVVRRRS